MSFTLIIIALAPDCAFYGKKRSSVDFLRPGYTATKRINRFSPPWLHSKKNPQQVFSALVTQQEKSSTGFLRPGYTAERIVNRFSPPWLHSKKELTTGFLRPGYIARKNCQQVSAALVTQHERIVNRFPPPWYHSKKQSSVGFLRHGHRLMLLRGSM